MIIEVRVKPGSRVSALERADGSVWIARLKSPPVAGYANRELIELVAKQFGCRKSAVSIKRGASSRTKLVEIDGV